MEHVDWRLLGGLAADHMGGAVMGILLFALLGVVVSLLIVLLFHKLGVFRRPTNKWYGRLVKLYIPFIVIVCVVFGAQIGFYRAVHRSVSAMNEEVVGTLYDRGIAPYVGSPEQKQAVVASLAQAYLTTHNIGDAVGDAIKRAVHSAPPSEQNMSQKATAYVVDAVIVHYKDDIAAAVIYGLYAMGGDKIGAHPSGEPIPYEVFKGALDQLLKADVRTIETAVKGDLSGVVQKIIDGQYHAIRKHLLIMAALFLLVPLVEWGLYLLFTRRERTPAPDVLRAEDAHVD